MRSIGKAQTFLGAAQVDELAAMYVVGATVREVAEHFRVHHTTALAHLKRRAVPLRRRGLDPADIADAAALYEQGLTLMEVGLRFGVSQGAVRRALSGAGLTIRPRGRRVG